MSNPVTTTVSSPVEQPEPGPLKYAQDLRMDDVTGLVDYLTGRLDATRDKHRTATEEWRALYALARAVSDLRIELTIQFDREQDVAAGAREESRVDRLNRQYAIRNLWNRLVDIGSTWREQDGYDAARWVFTEDEDPAAEARRLEVEAIVKANLDAAREAGPAV